MATRDSASLEKVDHRDELFIGGALTAPSGRRRITPVDPSTEEPLPSVPEAGAADVDAAVGAVRRAFDDPSGWSGCAPASLCSATPPGRAVIRRRRLERCARDLADPALAERPVAVIAACWGLPDSRHFARLFKAAYGRTPRDYRRDPR
jgi:AraC-like DNA-binding protein